MIGPDGPRGRAGDEGDTGTRSAPRRAVVTVGTFDGVHAGHRALLREVCRSAEARGGLGLLVTFDRHPLSVVRPAEAPALLTDLHEKKEVLATTELDRMAVLPFTTALSRLPAEDFVRDVLVGRFGLDRIVIGPDHGFGRRRSGDVETLHRLGRTLGFEVDVVEDVAVGGEAVSSTRIRRLLEEGSLEEANDALGRPYSAHGRVVRGTGRGRSLGFPTANLRVPCEEKLLPQAGIYAVRASLRGGIHDGLVHLGPRPTFEDAPPSLELHLLDHSGGDLYGERVKLEFLRRLRDVEAFDSPEALVERMEEDREEAVRYFALQRSAGSV